MTVVCLASITTTGKGTWTGIAIRNGGTRVVAAIGRLPAGVNGHDTLVAAPC